MQSGNGRIISLPQIEAFFVVLRFVKQEDSEMKSSLPLVGLLLLLLVYPKSISAETQQYNEMCTPTKTIRFDIPDFEWQKAEERDRAKYGPQEHRIFRVEELANMISPPQTAAVLLRNLKVVV